MCETSRTSVFEMVKENSVAARPRRLRGANVGAVIVASSLLLLPSLALIFVVIRYGFSLLGEGPFIIVLVLIWLRAALMGIFVSRDEMVIRSWFRNYRIPFDAIVSIDFVPYEGFLNQNAISHRVDPFYRAARILRLGISGRGLHDYPSTIGGRRRLERIVGELRVLKFEGEDGEPG